MSLTLIMAIIAAIGIGGMVLKSYTIGESRGEAKVEAKYLAAEKKAEALAAEKEAQGQKHTDEVLAAYQAGESKARIRYIEIRDKGASDVQKYPVFSNPVCTLPDESLGNLNAARAAIFGMQPSSDSSSQLPATPRPTPTAGTVPPASSAPTAGRKDGDPVPAVNSGHRPLGAVRPSPK